MLLLLVGSFICYRNRDRKVEGEPKGGRNEGGQTFLSLLFLTTSNNISVLVVLVGARC